MFNFHEGHIDDVMSHALPTFASQENDCRPFHSAEAPKQKYLGQHNQ